MLAIAAKERAGKDIGSANTMAAQAKTAAEERLAKKDVRKAQRQMARVQAEKRRTVQKVQRVVKRDAKKYAKHSKYAKKASTEQKELKKASERNHKMKRRLKEAHTGTTATTLLHRMYRPIPYEKACGSLAKDPKKLRQTSAKTVGACAAKCAALGKCRSFQFDKKLCTLSAKTLVRPSKYGAMLACPTRNVLITASMKLSAQPSTFDKKSELGESQKYGFETPGDKKFKAKAKKSKKATKKAVKQKKKQVKRKMKKLKAKLKKGPTSKKHRKMKKKLKKLSKKKKKLKRVSKKLKGKSGGGSSLSKRVQSLKAALQVCRGGIRRVSAKAVESNKLLVAASERRQKGAKNSGKRQEKAMLSSRVGRVKMQAAKAISAVKSVANERAKKQRGQFGKVRMAKAKKAKAVAKAALKKAMHFSRGEKKMMKNEKKMATKLG